MTFRPPVAPPATLNWSVRTWRWCEGLAGSTSSLRLADIHAQSTSRAFVGSACHTTGDRQDGGSGDEVRADRCVPAVGRPLRAFRPHRARHVVCGLVRSRSAARNMVDADG